MSDYKLPELPSDDELGIDDEDLKEFLEEEDSELSDAEMQALLGESPKPKSPPPADAPSSQGGKSPKKGRPKKAKKAKEAKGSWWRRTKAPKEPKKPAEPTKAEEPKKPEETKKPEGPTEPAEPKATREPVPEPPPTRWRGPVTLVLLVLGAWLGLSERTLPRPVAANAADTVFSSARAMTHVVEIARAAHPTGSPEHDRVRAYILDELRDLGLEPEVQTATAMIRRGSRLRGATVRNVVARIPGTDNTGAVLVTAHYDGAELSRGAADDGAGVVSILESLRALRASGPLRNDVIVLITDAEELWLLGAQAFVDEHPWMDDVQAVISIEMRGGGGASVMFETGAEYGWIVEAYEADAPSPYANSLVYEVYKRMPNDTDFTRFREAGKQGLNFAAVGRAHVYHQVYDSPENLHEGTLQHHGLNTLSMLRRLGDEDLSDVRAPDVVYFSVPVLGLVVYPEGWIWPLTGLVVLLWLAVGALARRTGLSIWGMVTGLAGSAAALGALYAAGLWGSRWLMGFHPEQGAIVGSAFHVEGWYVATLAALALVVVTGFWGIARRWFSVSDLATGAGLLIVPAVVGITYFVPLGAMNLQWPALAFLVASAATLIPAAGGLREARWILTALGALVVVIMLAPVVEMFWLTMSIRLAPALGVLIVLLLLLALPALDALREPNSWWAPTTALLLAGTFLGVGMLQARPSADRPLPSTLIYTLDKGSGEALWATQPGSGEDDPARAWAQDQVSVTFGDIRSLEAFRLGTDPYAVAAAPVVNTPALSVTLDSTWVVDGTLMARVAARSTLSAELSLVLIPEGGPTLTAMNGRTLPTTQPDGEPATAQATRVEHWGRPDGALLLDLVVQAGDTALSFDIIEHTLRPGELFGVGVFQRPPGLAPNVVLSSDRAMIRTPVFIPVQALPGVTPPPVEATPRETAPSDTLTPETLVSDTLQPDTVAPDTTTVPPDTLPPPDTIRP